MNTVIIIQARVGGTRLPGKVLEMIAGKPMLTHVVERAAMTALADGVVVACPTGQAVRLQPVVGDVRIIEGDENDVLARYLVAAEATTAERIVRVTADCPFLDPAIVDSTIRLHEMDKDAVYVSNVHPRRTFPDGLDVEVFTYLALFASDLSTVDRCSELEVQSREHVTTYMRALYKDAPCLESPLQLGHLKWSVDTPAELEFARQVMSRTTGVSIVDTIHAIKAAGLWDRQPASDDFRREHGRP